MMSCHVMSSPMVHNMGMWWHGQHKLTIWLFGWTLFMYQWNNANLMDEMRDMFITFFQVYWNFVPNLLKLIFCSIAFSIHPIWFQFMQHTFKEHLTTLYISWLKSLWKLVQWLKNVVHKVRMPCIDTIYDGLDGNRVFELVECICKGQIFILHALKVLISKNDKIQRYACKLHIDYGAHKRLQKINAESHSNWNGKSYDAKLSPMVFGGWVLFLIFLFDGFLWDHYGGSAYMGVLMRRQKKSILLLAGPFARGPLEGLE
jgi:hypothetical protein